MGVVGMVEELRFLCGCLLCSAVGSKEEVVEELRKWRRLVLKQKKEEVVGRSMLER